MPDISIDELLGSVRPSDKGAPAPGAPGEDGDSLVRRLAEWSSGGRDMFVDLRTVRFRAGDNGMWLDMPEGALPRRLDFKRDPTSPKDPRIVHAQKQFCRLLGVPHSFFSSNRPAMRESIVRSLQAGLDADDKKGRAVARIREGASVAMIRAIFAERAVPPRSSDVVSAVLKALGGNGGVEFAFGDGKDDLILHARFVTDDRVPFKGAEYRMAFDLVFSELGACPMSVDALVHDPVHKVSFAALYGGDPFFTSKYVGLQAQQVSEMVPALLERLRGEAGEIGTALRAATEGIYSVRQDCLHICRSKGLTAPMRTAVFHEAEQAGDIVTRLDLARHVALVAKDFDSLKRLALERAAGRYVNLVFSRAVPDEDTGNGEEETTQEG